jgi:pyruvate/2-oxoglutarate/acetoin dehydrogenase E1 component/TPP-dependent pyruvate/acetoin dehydrogenase alpha subunit
MSINLIGFDKWPVLTTFALRIGRDYHYQKTKFMAVKAKKSNKVSSIKAKDILKDYQLACESREASLLGRKEVFMGKAKFGIFGDGKELPQLAMAKAFQNGDFRSGYYRDQTFMLAIEQLTIQQYFAQLYAHTDVEQEPASAGRLMNGHFATRMVDDNGQLKDLVNHKNSTADISPTAGQMPRLLGLAYASKLFRGNKELHQFDGLSINGNEVAFGTIGNASTSEGMFYETVNAGGVLQVPMIISIWDDEYGISVPKEFHTTKGSISKVLSGFQRTKKENGYEIFVVKGWDYQALVETYQKAAKLSREEHVPVIVHVIEVTQPQGHSTSGSHERYKSQERLAWELEYDCNVQMRKWILEDGISDEATLLGIEKEAVNTAKEAKNAAWKAFVADIKIEVTEVADIIAAIASSSQHQSELTTIKDGLSNTVNAIRMDVVRTARKVLRLVRAEEGNGKETLKTWLKRADVLNWDRYNNFLYSEYDGAALNVEEVKAQINESAEAVDGREVLQACFDAALSRDPRVFAFGEDVGKIGDVNQAFAGLQDKYGDLKVTDTGIRECTIIGQAIGASLRGLRPIVEIQYLDYLLYALQTLSDDVACLQYRTKGGQKAPLIVRTRGHRLEGVWHSGSPMGMILHSLRGMYVLVPRNMTQAAGFYNTMLKSDDPALIIECLNGYRLKEHIPENIGEFTVPLGVPDALRSGDDVTIVTYGSMCRIVMDAAKMLDKEGISCEVIDVQTLLPFDIDHTIVESLKKTNRIVFADEDVPGGATAFMMQKVLEEQNGYKYLDSKPLTIAAQEHRPAYSSDGDYFSKPSVEDVFDKVYDLMAETKPDQYPEIY